MVKKSASALDQIAIDWSELQGVLEQIEKPKVAMRCSLCEKIWSSKEAYQSVYGDHWNQPISIIMEDRKPWLYVPCEDDWYSRTVMQINFCPKCGRRLNNG